MEANRPNLAATEHGLEQCRVSLGTLCNLYLMDEAGRVRHTPLARQRVRVMLALL